MLLEGKQRESAKYSLEMPRSYRIMKIEHEHLIQKLKYNFKDNFYKIFFFSWVVSLVIHVTVAIGTSKPFTNSLKRPSIRLIAWSQ